MPEAGTLAYLGSTPLNYGTFIIEDKPVTLNPTPDEFLPTASLSGWLSAATYTSTDSWYSRQGNATASLSGSVPPSWKSDFGGIFNYTTASNSTITGPIPDVINTLTGSNYTIFVIGRQSGSASDYHGRMLSAGLSNWLLGTYGGGGAAGTAEFNNAFWPWRGTSGGFTIQSGSIYDTEWRVHTALKNSTTASYYLNGQFIAQTTGISATSDGPQDLGVNKNFGTFNELNQMDIGDIVVYNRALSPSEIETVYSVISPRFGL